MKSWLVVVAVLAAVAGSAGSAGATNYPTGPFSLGSGGVSCLSDEGYTFATAEVWAQREQRATRLVQFDLANTCLTPLLFSIEYKWFGPIHVQVLPGTVRSVLRDEVAALGLDSVQFRTWVLGCCSGIPADVVIGPDFSYRV
jgi:hypothetical protein